MKEDDVAIVKGAMVIDLKGQGNEPMLSSSPLSDKLRDVCTVSHSGCHP